MEKQLEVEKAELYMSKRGQQRLLFYAQILEEIADYYDLKPNEVIKGDRMLLWNHMMENNQNQIMKDQFRNLSNILTHIADERCVRAEGYDKKKKRIIKKLEENDLVIFSLEIMQFHYQRLQIEMECMAKKGDYYSTEELAEFIGSIIHKKMMPDKDMPAYIRHKREYIVLREELTYQYYIGTARAVKDGETESGDYLLYADYADGRSFISLADGMGSGKQAGEDAAFVLELLDKFLEAGMTIKEATCQVNDVLCMRCRQLRTVSVDSMIINLCSGEATIQKSGASPLFIKRGDMVIKKQLESLPLGIIPGSYGDTDQIYLAEGDQLIFVSDGVLESLKDEDGERLKQMIEKIDMIEPKKYAAKLLALATMASGGIIPDDMTVVVVNICEGV